MPKRIISSLFLTLFLCPQVLAFSLPSVSGGEAVDPRVELAELSPVSAKINANSNVEVNKSIIFDASGSSTVDGGELTYEWFFGDGNRQQGQEVVHSYAEPGDYEVTLVVRDGNDNQSAVLHDVFVYEHSIALITNISEEKERIDRFLDSAKNERVFVRLIESFSSQSEFLAEEELKTSLSKNINLLQDVDTILIWTKGSAGLTVLSQLDKSDIFHDKNIIYISDQDFGALKNIARGVFTTINPNQIILTRIEAIWVTLEQLNIENFISILDERAIQYEVVDEKLHLKPWNLMSYLVNLMIERGVPSNTLQLVLILPVIVSVVAFMKQVVGLTTLGVYTPSILALSFIALDISYGLLFLISILIIGTLTRLFLRQYRLLYIPRMAIVLTIVSLTILLLLFLGAYFNISQIVGISVFPMLIMSTMVEKFVSIQSGKGLKSAVILITEAVFVAVLCYFIAEWPFLKITVLGHPEVIFLFLLFNIFLARWTGLRLIEYVRFREIFRHLEE